MFCLSLLDEEWIPVRHFNGQISKIKPSQIADETLSDLAYFRPDFQGAAYQFLIGLLQTTFSPEDNDEWLEYWHEGITQSQLDEAFKPAKQAMQFGEHKPAFMQDFTPLDGNKVPISGLLVEAPGENALKKNTDHFIKRDFVKAICPHCAVMALFTLQTNAPSGGQGHRVSLRGGGPITTLMMPALDTSTPLWKKLWLNVMPLDDDEKPQHYDETVFPWLNKTVTSEPPKNLSVFPEQANCCQAYWGMPRRIELDFENTTQGDCDLCGEKSPELISQYQTKNYGVQYKNWRHPLSPYRTDSKTGEPIAIKGQPGGLIYRDWLGMVSTNDETQSARLVAVHYSRGLRASEKYHLWCFGYDFDNMKARCWYEHTFPVYAIFDDLDSDIKELITLALDFSKDTLPILRKAMSSINKQSSTVDIAYWKETETPFYQYIKQLIEEKDNPNGRFPLLFDWTNTLLKYITQVYDKAAFADPDQLMISSEKITARENLIKAFNKLRNIKKIKNNKSS
ncbi:type I-E CRISPR-associated protein Cse1/CasA [Gilliamella sp. Nev5-1]|uniref:type I-E CRISPR-associated protein Cse1/CasA n=1 Tax=unclassified Gilliamella TaxID=2685620 RepID=UPI00080E2BB4|nr:type I-E CRISPR-associated protein Cse1/CasA [Gilliamella apicola]OCG59161.1 type I-E CRISPR-associated protein Cse1/CasA [Gilliamella apicola]OCG68383.1 type I-E CRISPR-associated protein Cse1/CasA [Gilliamella apicola]